MGISLVVGLLSAAAGVAGAVIQAKAAKESAAAQREANEVQSSQQKVESRESRRSVLRKERIQRKAILAQSQNEGVSGSSGEVGAIGALNTNLAGKFGQSLGQGKANEGINAANQRAADAQAKGAAGAAFFGAIGSALGAFA